MHRPTIELLSEETINQIAAGEVVENPASVVKELIENALDAESCQIDIEIHGGGYGLIRVSDDGVGMSPADAELCLERYATSKIRSAEDLEQLGTLGFRGEALSSIAAISRLKLLTSDGKSCTALEVEGGKRCSSCSGARGRGTTVEVRSLFYNVPARKKFQKTAARSSIDVSRVIGALSLSFPDVGFCFKQGDEMVLDVPRGQTLHSRIPLVLGEEYRKSVPVSWAHDLLTVAGVVGEPRTDRATRGGQYLFVGKRFVTSPLIQYAVKDAYASRLQERRHPIWVLYVNPAPHSIDVNVHPQKREVRFAEEKWVRQMVQEAVSLALSTSEMPEPAVPFFFPEAMPPFVAGESIPSQSSFLWRAREEMPRGVQLQMPQSVIPLPIGLFRHYLLLEGASVPTLHLGKNHLDGIVLVDLVAVQKRLAFELVTKGDARLQQGLLLPFTLECSVDERQLLLSHIDELQRLGFQMREAGPRTLLIDAIPSFLERSDLPKILQELLQALQFPERSPPIPVVVTASVRSKKTFVLQEALELFQQVLKSQDPYHCPKGKLTMVHLYAQDIATYFSAR